MSNIGMMDGAFFVGRKEIIDWINQTLNINISKVEQTASGAIACQLLDVMYPDQVPMHKVNWSAKQDFEFIQNYKILQTCFTKLHIDRHVDVDRLIKGRYQDNLEFMQWFKRFFEMGTNSDHADYDPLTRRSRGKGGAQYPYNASGSSRQESNTTSNTASTSTATSKSKGRIVAPPTRVKAPKENTQTQTQTQTNSNSSNQKIESSRGSPQGLPSTSTFVSVSAPSTAPSTQSQQSSSSSEAISAEALNTINHLQNEIERLQNVNDDLQAEMNGIEKERDFYFDKLRDIEMMLQDIEDADQGNGLTASIFKILYATADGFQAVDEPTENVENAMEPSNEAEEEDETY